MTNMIYKVTARGSIEAIKTALDDAFFNQWEIMHVIKRDKKIGITKLEISSPVQITCLVEPIIGIELKFKEG